MRLDRLALLLALAAPALAFARGGGWEETSPEVRKWYQNLMQPDTPYMSCCGEADAYYADSFEVEGDHYVAIITDDRGDVMANGVTRPHIEPGTRIPVPNNKMKWDAGNPTGHGVIFLAVASGLVYCYVTPAGI